MSKKSKRKDGRPLAPQSQSSIGFLEDMVQSDENLVPCFVEKCIRFIEEEGISAEGLYRVPGNRAHVDSLMEKFNEGKYIFKSLFGRNHLFVRKMSFFTREFLSLFHK